MKKIAFLLFMSILFYSCLNNDTDEEGFSYELLKIDEAKTPESFTFGKTDSITIKYTLAGGCRSFDRLYYEQKDNTRIVAVTVLVNLENPCTLDLIPEEYKFAVTANQTEDYIFKFYKGKDSNGDNLYDEVIIPVN